MVSIINCCSSFKIYQDSSHEAGASAGAPSPPSPAAAPSSSSIVNSFFLTVLSWFLKLNSAAFFWSLANLFSYFETFFNVGLMNFPLRSLTAMLSSLICAINLIIFCVNILKKGCGKTIHTKIYLICQKKTREEKQKTNFCDQFIYL